MARKKVRGKTTVVSFLSLQRDWIKRFVLIFDVFLLTQNSKKILIKKEQINNHRQYMWHPPFFSSFCSSKIPYVSYPQPLMEENTKGH